jgi:membrane protease subunit HflC
VEGAVLRRDLQIAAHHSRVAESEIVDVRVKRIEFSDEVSESVFNRMRKERARIAAELRAQGAESAEQIRADADRQRTVILATAYRDAEKLRGEGDASAAQIYADAYSKNPEFFAFYRSISAYKRSLGQPNDVVVLDARSDFFRSSRFQSTQEISLSWQ